MAEVPDNWKVCALCRHLESVVSGQSIEGLNNSEYTLFRCRKLDVYRCEEYLMVPAAESTEEMDACAGDKDVCPYWEGLEENTEKFIGLPDFDSDMTEGDLESVLKNILKDASDEEA